MRVREKNDLDHWLRFFLTGVIETARGGIATFDGILNLQRDVDERLGILRETTGAQRGRMYLFQAYLDLFLV